MKNFYFAILLLIGTSVCHAELLQVNTMDELESCFKDADANTLAIFDVDMVLVQPDNPAFQMPNMKRYSSIAKRIMGQMPKDKQMEFLALMTTTSKTILIDNKVPAFFHSLAMRKIPAMALTANLTGEFSGIKNMEQHRKNTLQALGIDFSKTSPCKTPFIFTELAAYRGNYTTYIDGMLFVNGKDVSKGEALIAFLNKAALSPTKIIFVDDREENVKSVEEAANNLGIAFIGVHYLGAAKYPSAEISEREFEQEWARLACKINN